MNDPKKIEDKLIEEINTTLKSFASFEKAKVTLQGDIIIKRKYPLKKAVNNSLLTDVFKQIISNDIKKNRV
jgi:hypothetical protein